MLAPEASRRTISTDLAPPHASYRGSELFWATGRLMSDCGFGTSCWLHCGRLTVSASSEDSRKRFFFIKD